MQGAADAFWQNAPGPGGIGLQDRYEALWGHLAQRFGAHPAVVGYDVWNEPTPGALAGEAFGTLIGAFAHATGQAPEQIAAGFADPAAKLALLGQLEDATVHRALGGRSCRCLAEF